jgi:MFS superfamily sulfate permease-like transporter
MIALLEAKAAGLWSRMHSPGSLPRGVVVYSIDGALFFGAAEKLEQTLALKLYSRSSLSNACAAVSKRAHRCGTAR